MWKRTVAVLMMLALLVGCGQVNHLAQAKPAVHTPEGTEVCLKIVTEDSQFAHWVRLGEMLEVVMDAYNAAHPGVTFEVEYLPHEEDEQELRKMRIQQIRSEILAGNGPDIYILSDLEDLQSEPLFTDVNVAIRNGAFHEISAYYNADQELHKEELKQEIMDAGTFGEARYVLPFAFNMGVVHVDEEAADAYGLSLEALTASAGSYRNALLEAMERTGELGLAKCRGLYRHTSLYPFGKMVDYDEEKVLLKQETLSKWFRQELQIDQLRHAGRAEGREDKFSAQHTLVQLYMEDPAQPTSWFQAGNPAFIEDAASAFEYAIINKAEPGSYVDYPLRGEDGTVTAKVTWWGAVGSGCDYADLAYGFLREFLTREIQWDLNHPPHESYGSEPLTWDGIPVRTQGSVAPMLARYKLHIRDFSTSRPPTPEEDLKQKLDRLMAVEMTDEDFPILETKIDHVIFGSVWEPEFHLLTRDWYDTASRTYRDVDFDQEAADYIRYLDFFLGES